jgi:hypothetical protein
MDAYLKLLALCILTITIWGCPKKKPMVQNEMAKVPYKDTAFTNNFKLTSGLIAGDVGYSIPINSNKNIWLFSDSYIDNYDASTQTTPCLFQVNNAALVHTINSNNFTTYIGNAGNIKSLFKYYPDGSNKSQWVGNGYLLADTLYVYLQGISYITTNGITNFAANGQDFIAKVNPNTLATYSYHLLPAMDTVFYGSAFIYEPSQGYVYAYGVKNDFIESNVYLARFRANSPHNSFEFFTGSQWTSNQAFKSPIARGSSYSVHVSKINGKYVLVTSEFSVGCNQGTKILYATASQPQGPFSTKKTLWQVDDLKNGVYPFMYFPIIHPEYTNSNGELLLTYNINGYEPCIPNCINGRRNPNDYRLKAIRIPAAFIE